MRNDYIAPVDHGLLSATGTVVAGTAGGALKSVAKTSAWAIGLSALAGGLSAVALGAVALATVGGIAAAFAAAPVPVILGGLAVGFTGTVVGGLTTGLLASAFAAPFAAVFGAGKGMSRASERVSLERAAAKEVQMQMQFAAYQAAAASNDNKYNFPPRGAMMNAAAPTIQADTAQAMGTVNAQQLQRA